MPRTRLRVTVLASLLAASTVLLPATEAVAATSPVPSLAASSVPAPPGSLPTNVVPQATGLAPVCAGKFAGLACESERVTTGGHANRTVTGTAPIGWGATDLEKAYRLPPHQTATRTIAIIDVGADPRLGSDLASYRSQYGLPACEAATGCFQQISYNDGPALSPATTPAGKAMDEDIAFETSLDVDMASAACPSCRILEVQIPDSFVPAEQTAAAYDKYAQAFGTAVQTAVTRGAAAINISYGLPGDSTMLTGTDAADLDHRGVAIAASAGDEGFYGDGYVWPQALKTVTSVGGTELVEQSGRYSEGAWSYAGSACVPAEPPPAGQPAATSALCGGARADTDVSAVADGVAVYDSYTPSTGWSLGWQVAAGTSVASPLIAGMYAAAGHLGGVLGPNTLYRAFAGAFNDVTSGTNGGISSSDGSCVPAATVLSGQQQSFPNRLCQAQAGWDGPTGLGTPNGLAAF
jgi:subtilase family serine protease